VDALVVSTFWLALSESEGGLRTSAPPLWFEPLWGRSMRCLVLAATILASACAGAAGAQPPLHLQLLRPEAVTEGSPSPYDVGDVTHPLPYARVAGNVGAAESSADGVLMSVGLPDPDTGRLAAGASGSNHAALFLQLFTTSYASPHNVVEQWFAESGAPSRENHLRLTSLFDAFFHKENDGLIVDEHGDSCVGYFLKAELCLQALSCIPLSTVDGVARGTWGGGGGWEIWLPTPVATNFRLETYVSGDACDPAFEASPIAGDASTNGRGPLARRVPRLAEAPVAEKGTFLLGRRRAVAAQHYSFRLLFVDEPSRWWAERPWPQPLLPTNCWMDLMGTALLAAEPWLAHPESLWLEFGVASGRSLAFISGRLKKEASSHVVVHAFDSFQGIPVGWHRYNPQSFSMEGKPPEFIESLSNVRLHIGYFSDTLNDLDPFRTSPVAFVHVDADLFASAREVLGYLRCQIFPGTVIVFDEFFNYVGWERDGEYRAFKMLVDMYGLRWTPLGYFFEQAVAVVAEGRAAGC